MTISDFNDGYGQVPSSVSKSYPYENLHCKPCHSHPHFDHFYNHKNYNDRNAHYNSSSHRGSSKFISHIVVNPVEQQFDFSTKDGLYAYTRVTLRDSDFKRISISVGTAQTFLDMIKDKALQFSWDPIINIPTSGSGKPSYHLHCISTLEIFKADLQWPINLLEGYQSLSDDQVIAFQDGFMVMLSHFPHQIENQLSRLLLLISIEIFVF